MTYAESIASFIVVVFLGGLLYLNLLHWRSRAAMTPEERRQHDRDLRTTGDW